MTQSYKELFADFHGQDKESYSIELVDGSQYYPHKDDQNMYPEIVAASLSKLCRFTGHTDIFYSVAEHSVKASHMVPPEYAYEALLHDAHECIVNDLSLPIKAYIGGSYEALEDKVELDIRRNFGLSDEMSEEVKKADIFMVIIEGHYLLRSLGRNWTNYDHCRQQAMAAARNNPFLVPSGWGPQRAEDEFNRRFRELRRQRQGL